MLNLPVEFTTMMLVFAPLFSKQVWQHVQVLVVGAILSQGLRTVTAILRVVGLSQEENASILPPRCLIVPYGQVGLSVKFYSNCSQRVFAPQAPLVMGLDDTTHAQVGRED